MKKLLLIAALAAIAFGASADGYKIEKVWELNDMTTLLGDRMEVRQGFGMDGKFYINNKKQVFDTVAGVYTTVPTIYEIDENGLTGVTFPGGKNCGITRDEAGNIIVSLAPFSLSWIEAGIRVIDPATGEYKDYMIPEEIAIIGRSDFLGFAKGNLMEEGELWMTGTNQGTGFTHLAIADGEVDMDVYQALKSRFTAALDNDLNASLAVTALYDVLKAKTNDATKLYTLGNFDQVLSLSLLEKAAEKREELKKQAVTAGAFTIIAEDGSPDETVEEKIRARRDAKKAKDFALADAIRDELKAAGVELTDIPNGVRWKRI